MCDLPVIPMDVMGEKIKQVVTNRLGLYQNVAKDCTDEETIRTVRNSSGNMTLNKLTDDYYNRCCCSYLFVATINWKDTGSPGVIW